MGPSVCACVRIAFRQIGSMGIKRVKKGQVGSGAVRCRLVVSSELKWGHAGSYGSYGGQVRLSGVK